MSHPKFVNRGRPLGKFVEECGEALAAAGKTIRFGLNSVNPLMDTPLVREFLRAISIFAMRVEGNWRRPRKGEHEK